MHWCELMHTSPHLWACLLFTTNCEVSEKPKMFNNSPFTIHYYYYYAKSGLSLWTLHLPLSARLLLQPPFLQVIVGATEIAGLSDVVSYPSCGLEKCIFWSLPILPLLFPLSFLFLSSKTNKQLPFSPSHQSTWSFLCTSRGINPPSGLPDCSGSRHSNQSWTLKMSAQRWKISSV